MMMMMVMMMMMMMIRVICCGPKHEFSMAFKYQTRWRLMIYDIQSRHMGLMIRTIDGWLMISSGLYTSLYTLRMITIHELQIPTNQPAATHLQPGPAVSAASAVRCAGHGTLANTSWSYNSIISSLFQVIILGHIQDNQKSHKTNML